MIGIDHMQIVGDGEKAETAVDLSGVGLRAGPDAEPAVEVFAGKDEFRGFGDVDGVETVEKAQSGDGAKGEPSIHFPVDVAEKRTVILRPTISEKRIVVKGPD